MALLSQVLRNEVFSPFVLELCAVVNHADAHIRSTAESCKSAKGRFDPRYYYLFEI